MISPTLVYDPMAKQVARAIVSAGAYVMNPYASPDEFYIWKSGIHAPVYTDCRMLAGHPGAYAIIKRALKNSIRENFPTVEYIVGMESAGIIWSSLAADALSLPGAYVRKQAKEHGRKKGQRVECSPPRGVHAVLVDDLVASGGSLHEAVHVLREEEDIQVIGIQSIVNWDFIQMRDRFRPLGIRVRALVSFPQLLEVGVEEGILTHSAAEELKVFYQNPREHKWNLDALRGTAEGQSSA